MTLTLSLLISAYLLGSIPFGYWLVKWVKGVDVRSQGSGNIGMTNVWRAVGPGWGIATLLLDITKGAAAVALARHEAPDHGEIAVFCGLAVLLGNVFSLFLKLKGGKGIGVSIGVFFSLLPLESALGTAAFALGLGLTRMISVGSLLGVTAMAISAILIQKITWASGLALFAWAMVGWTHRQNIHRILNGSENKVGKKRP